MILTNEKMEVTYYMMFAHNMTNECRFGIPVDPANPSKGLVWKELGEMEDSDFDKIEEYFILKQMNNEQA